MAESFAIAHAGAAHWPTWGSYRGLAPKAHRPMCQVRGRVLFGHRLLKRRYLVLAWKHTALLQHRTDQPHPPELELELIQPHMAQKPVLRGEVGCACFAREVSVERARPCCPRRHHMHDGTHTSSAALARTLSPPPRWPPCALNSQPAVARAKGYIYAM